MYNLPPFAQLAGLGSLRALHYAVYAGGDAPGGLPPGACQLSVQHLAVEERLLHESRAWVEGAAALERLLIKWWVPEQGGLCYVGRWRRKGVQPSWGMREGPLSTIGPPTLGAPLLPPSCTVGTCHGLPTLCRYIYPDCRAPGGRDLGAPKWGWLWAWAAAHAPLRTLCFDLGEGDELAGLEAAAQRLRACRPELRLERCRFSTAWQEPAAEWQ